MQKLDIHQDIWKKLEYFYYTQKIPHILFYGEHGAGKKTLVMNFIKLIYGNDTQKIKQNTLFSNCSHFKGIRHIRDNLKEYSRSNVQISNSTLFKIIVLYNFENLSDDGQSALRRIIETYSQYTRFFIILQNKQKILQPIISRFSYIYIPLPIINGKPQNLYKICNEQLNNLSSSSQTTTVSSVLLPYLDNSVEAAGAPPPPHPTNKSFIEMADTLYNEGLSCLDIIQFVKETDKICENTKILTITCFHKIKSEFKNEKLLMLYLFDYIFSRSDKEIQNISFL